MFVHPDSLDQLDRDRHAAVPADLPRSRVRGTLVGEPVDLYMYNDTISNSGQGRAHQLRRTATTPPATPPIEAVLLNNTFYNDHYAIQTIAPQFDGKNGLAIVNVLAMNNIFDGSSQIAVNHRKGRPAIQPAPVQPVLQQRRPTC